MATLVATMVSSKDAQTLKSLFETGVSSSKHATVQDYINYVTALSAGNLSAAGAGSPPSISFSINDYAVQGNGTLTFVSAVATNTFSIASTTFTAVASGATGNQFNIGVSDNATAANAAAAINASATALVNTAVTASAANNVVTITSKYFGPAGNQTIFSGGTNIGASGSRLSGGALDPNAVTLSF